MALESSTGGCKRETLGIGTLPISLHVALAHHFLIMASGRIPDHGQRPQFPDHGQWPQFPDHGHWGEHSEEHRVLA